MIELFEKSGILTMGSRLRWLTEAVTRDAGEIYRLYGIDIRPKWFPVLYMLYYGEDNTVTGIAKAIGQTHPSVSNIVREMKEAGLVSDTKSADDRRATSVSLTSKGRELEPLLKQACDDVTDAVASIEDTDHSLWDAISCWEQKLSEKTLLERVKDVMSSRENRDLKIVDYNPEYLMVFKRLNIMWINSHWSLEPHDLEVLGDPDGSILAKGGFILVALMDGKPMGVVAMCRMDGNPYDFELAKLAVDPGARGNGLGEMICRSALERAATLGARKIFLESNTLLKPAIRIYRKLGFKELTDYHPAYQRGDIQMELIL